MASCSRISEDPWIHKKEDAKGGDDVDAESVQGPTEQRVIIIGAGEYLSIAT